MGEDSTAKGLAEGVIKDGEHALTARTRHVTGNQTQQRSSPHS